MSPFRLPDKLASPGNRNGPQKRGDASVAGEVRHHPRTSGVDLEALRRLARGRLHMVVVTRNPEGPGSSAIPQSRNGAC